jgi:hypothetical protein
VVSTTARPLYPRDRPGVRCTGGWVGPRASLDVSKKSCPHQDSIPGLSSPYSVAILTELPGPQIFSCIFHKLRLEVSVEQVFLIFPWFVVHLHSDLKVGVIFGIKQTQALCCSDTQTYCESFVLEPCGSIPLCIDGIL